MHAGLDFEAFKAALAAKGYALVEGQTWKGSTASYWVRLPCGHERPAAWTVVKQLRYESGCRLTCRECTRAG